MVDPMLIVLIGMGKYSHIERVNKVAETILGALVECYRFWIEGLLV